MTKSSRRCSDNDVKQLTPRAKRAHRAGKLCVTSRKPQPRRRLVQTVIVGFTAVAMPKTKTETETSLRERHLDLNAAAGLTMEQQLSLVMVEADIKELQWKCCKAEDGRDGPLRCRSYCRYVLEHEVQYGVRRGGPMGRRWLSAEEFEALDDAHKIEDDLDAGDGV
ncbi:uncharacterized protein IUM83_09766 [Phytophthora cinnamomi]|uniref:uncharacterized protein n=1 Tax=Phytophthora cinnamomi TaxID=4785 RepID=UPI003559FF7C|nr:hypothetical protein IUM83_09766 [Phytophthora cinnamomi]